MHRPGSCGSAIDKGVVMKGLGDERAEIAMSHEGRAVNSSQGQSPSAGGESCQERVDAKAFTGRGSHRELRQLQAEVDRLDGLMRQLSAASKQVEGAQIYLMLHHRHATGYQFLRWREVAGAKRHLSWEQGEAIYSRYAAPLRPWYEDIAAQARQVNEDHLKRRREIKSMRFWLSKQERQVFARPIPD